MDNLDRLSALLTPLLSDPEAMSSLRQAADQMGLGGLLPENDDSHTSAQAAPDEAAQRRNEPPQTGLPPELLSAVGRLMPLLSAPGEDDASRLLCALRPFLSSHRAKRLEEAERLLSLTRVLSILKESKLM